MAEDGAAKKGDFQRVGGGRAVYEWKRMISRGDIARIGREYPFGCLLIAIFALIVGAPLTTEISSHFVRLTGPVALAPLTALLTMASVLAVRDVTPYPGRMIALASGILFLLVLSSMITHRALGAAHLLAQAFFLGAVTWMILRAVFRASEVDGNTLCGAACVYLLAGVLCGYLFAMIEILEPGSFRITDPTLETKIVQLSSQPGWLIYFSFTTLTTVGFGDILPARSLARSLSVLEAVIGQIMVVVMIARLVGLHVAYSTSGRGRPVKFEIAGGDSKIDGVPPPK